MKTIKVLGAILVAVLLLASAFATYVNYRLPQIPLEKEISVKTNAERIERGAYLANHVAACMDCHSQRDWSSYAGPMVAGTQGQGGELFDHNAGFPGTIYASNLTPGNLSTWTDAEIYRAITSGEGKDGRALFPLMGYARFGKMDTEDIYSIIAYLRSLKPIAHDVPATQIDFPVSLFNKFGPQKAQPSAIPSKKDTILYGGYLTNAAGCVDCHSQMDKGKIIEGSEFGGGMEFRQPAGIIRSANITMHKTNGIGAWTSTAFIERFKMYADTGYVPQKIARNELNTPMPWNMYAGMTREDLGYIYAYLKSLPVKDNKVTIKTYQ